MRILLLVVLSFSFAAYGQRVRENIKQSASGISSGSTVKPVKKPIKK